MKRAWRNFERCSGKSKSSFLGISRFKYSSSKSAINDTKKEFHSLLCNIQNELPNFSNQHDHENFHIIPVSFFSLSSNPGSKNVSKKINIPNKESKNNLNLEEAPELDERAVYSKKPSISEKISEIYHHLKHSLKMVWSDTKKFSQLSSKMKSKTERFTLKDQIEKSDIKMDLLKFIPYSFFVFVPFAELLIPPYIWLFPRSTPNQFVYETTFAENNSVKDVKQKDGYKLLIKQLEYTFPREMTRLLEICQNLKTDPLRTDLEKELLTLDNFIVNELKGNWKNSYSKKYNLINFSLKEKEAILKFFFTDYISGKHIVNQVLNLPFTIANIFKKYVTKNGDFFVTRNFTLDVFPLNKLRHSLLDLQLKSHLKKIQKEDSIVKECPKDLSEISELQSLMITKRRGIKVPDHQERIEFMNRIWLREMYSIDDPILFMWICVLRYKYANRLI